MKPRDLPMHRHATPRGWRFYFRDPPNPPSQPSQPNNYARCPSALASSFFWFTPRETQLSQKNGEGPQVRFSGLFKQGSDLCADSRDAD